MKDVTDDEEGNPIFFVSKETSSSLVFPLGTGPSRKPPIGRAQGSEYVVAAILHRLDKIEATHHAYFLHVRF